ncbi:MAG TPA: hypothetical protein VGD65_25020 [Chryseosolibacter sp.]
MKSLQTFTQKFAVPLGMLAGFATLFLMVAVIISIPDEALLAITLVGLLCACFSMFLIARHTLRAHGGRQLKSINLRPRQPWART